MKLPELDRLLRGATASPATDFADTILARLPGMRFVTPGSHPGLRVLVLAGLLGLAAAAGIALKGRAPPASNPQPPPLTLFQPGAVEPVPVLPPP